MGSRSKKTAEFPNKPPYAVSIGFPQRIYGLAEQRRYAMNYFGLFFSFMIPSIILGFMIAAACIQERAIRRRRAQHKQAAPHKEANVRSYSPSAKPQHNNAVKSDKSKLYIYDMNAA